jgi:hypothetical protein
MERMKGLGEIEVCAQNESTLASSWRLVGVENCGDVVQRK